MFIVLCLGSLVVPVAQAHAHTHLPVPPMQASSPPWDAPLWLSHREGRVAGAPALGEVALFTTEPVADGSGTTGLRDLVPGFRAEPRALDWYRAALREDDLYLTDDILVDVWFRAHLDLEGQKVVVRLDDVAAEGEARPLADVGRTIPPTGAGPYAVRYTLPVAGTTLSEDHVLRLRIETPSILGVTWLMIGDPDRPSGILGLPVLLLDTDHDGLGDSEERRRGTSPMEPDTDGDSVLDGVEMRRGMDPRDPHDAARLRDARDRDMDGLLDREEAQHATDAEAPDSDGDGALDGLEVRHGTDPLDASSDPSDTDRDGLPDTDERVAGTDARLADSDGDGIRDCHEDHDGDGLDACTEAALGTHPHERDTDGDGRDDALELALGSDPLVPFTAQGGVRLGDADEMLWAARFFTGCLGLALFVLVRHVRDPEEEA